MVFRVNSNRRATDKSAGRSEQEGGWRDNPHPAHLILQLQLPDGITHQSFGADGFHGMVQQARSEDVRISCRQRRPYVGAPWHLDIHTKRHGAPAAMSERINHYAMEAAVG